MRILLPISVESDKKLTPMIPRNNAPVVIIVWK
jgi:hypothetical protein